MKHGHSHMQYTAAPEAFLEEKQSLKIQLFTKVDKKIYKQVIWVFCFGLS